MNITTVKTALIYMFEESDKTGNATTVITPTAGFMAICMHCV